MRAHQCRISTNENGGYLWYEMERRSGLCYLACLGLLAQPVSPQLTLGSLFTAVCPEVVQSNVTERSLQGGPGLARPPLFGERERPLEPIFTLDPRPHSRQRYPAFSLVELLQCCALIGRELQALKGPIIGALSDATPAILCHKEPARASKAPY